jgi:hypothetical protein
MPIITPEESHSIRVPCYNPAGENIITCQDNRKELFLGEVGGLQLDTIIRSNVTLPMDYIPVFDPRTLDQAVHSPSPIIGLTLSCIVRSAMTKRVGGFVTQPIRFHPKEKIAAICRAKQVVLFMTGQDTLIEWVWFQRDQCGLFEYIKEMGFLAVTGFNFSVFGGECPFAQALNQKKALYSSELMETFGIAVIPHMYAVNYHHLARYRQWLAKNPVLQLITINCQCQRKQSNISQLVHVVGSLLTENPRLHFLLQGFHFSEIYRLGNLTNRVHFADTKAVKYAQSFKRLGTLNKKLSALEHQFRPRHCKDLIIENTRIRSAELQHLRNEYGNTANTG